LTATFTDQSAGGPTSWAWDFGDPGSGSDNTSTIQNPLHTYASPGTYTVTLTPSNAAGGGTPATRTINVTDPPTGGSNVLVGAGDIANCNRTQDESTAQLLDGIAGTVFTAGDNAYESGTATEYANCYHPTWGRHKARTKPTPGNHEYQTTGASGYYGYYGSVAGDPTKGYYSFDISGWHVVMLNSNCGSGGVTGGCGTNSPQAVWLRADLAANSASCTIAMWHHPKFSSTPTSIPGTMNAMWTALYNDGADIIINGHHHNYERFAPQTPAGAADPAFGIREWVVGTGGQNLASMPNVKPNSQVRNSSTYGVLKLTLHANSYDWSFIPIAGQTFTDSGTGTCHGSPSGATQQAVQTAVDQQARLAAVDAVQVARRQVPQAIYACDIPSIASN
jgi:PKD repeat protein